MEIPGPEHCFYYLNFFSEIFIPKYRQRWKHSPTNDSIAGQRVANIHLKALECFGFVLISIYITSTAFNCSSALMRLQNKELSIWFRFLSPDWLRLDEAIAPSRPLFGEKIEELLISSFLGCRVVLLFCFVLFFYPCALLPTRRL